MTPERPNKASLALRSRTLDEIVKDEVTGGARIDHRDNVSAVLARGAERILVTVDEGGAVRVDRLEGSPPRRLRLVLLATIAIAALLLAVVLLAQLDIVP